MNEELEPKTYLSSSRISTFNTCSWLYYCKYILKLPDKSNSGASKGSVVHLVMEVLGEAKRRKSHYEKIIQSQDLESCPSIMRMVRAYAKKLNVASESEIEEVKAMAIRGLNYDFFGEDCLNVGEAFSEKYFEFSKKTDNVFYKTKGFLDKLFIDHENSKLLIRDFKSSKSVYKGKDITDNTQHLMYSLACRELYPDIKNRETEFLFLRHDMSNRTAKGVVRIESDDDELDSFEEDLTKYQIAMDSFSEKDSMCNMGYDYYPKDGSFSGALFCGNALEKGELKADGSLKWHCPVKFEIDYFIISNRKTGKYAASCFYEQKQEFLERFPFKDYFYDYKKYFGCPRLEKMRRRKKNKS